jgi:hypothetical protein
MRLSDAGLRRRQPKLIYPDHRPSPWRIEDAAPRSLEPIVRRRLIYATNLAMAAPNRKRTTTPSNDFEVSWNIQNQSAGGCKVFWTNPFDTNSLSVGRENILVVQGRRAIGLLEFSKR